MPRTLARLPAGREQGIRLSVSQAAGAVSELISQAERALASGDRARADALLLRVRAVDREHPAILNEAALQELRSGNAITARELLERAVARDGANTRLLMNLAGTLRKLGLAADEMRIIERVLAVEPRHLFALLQKATLLESQGKARAAAKVYHNALQTIPPGTSVPGALRGPIDKAIEATKANDAALDAHLTEQLQELRARHADAQQDRFDHCVDCTQQRICRDDRTGGADLGQRACHRAEPRQQRCTRHRSGQRSAVASDERFQLPAPGSRPRGHDHARGVEFVSHVDAQRPRPEGQARAVIGATARVT